MGVSSLGAMADALEDSSYQGAVMHQKDGKLSINKGCRCAGIL
jgi:hypothetical protein